MVGQRVSQDSYTKAEFDAVFETLPSNGWLTRDEARLLWKHLLLTKGDILEVGCYYGRSTVLLASLATYKGSLPPYTVHSVDPFGNFDSGDLSGDKVRDAFLENLSSRGIHNVTLYRTRIESWCPHPRPKIGLAYLDGDHTSLGTAIQIQTSLQCGAEVILIHDVNDSGNGAAVKNAALALLGPWSERVGRLAVWTGIESS